MKLVVDIKGMSLTQPYDIKRFLERLRVSLNSGAMSGEFQVKDVVMEWKIIDEDFEKSLKVKKVEEKPIIFNKIKKDLEKQNRVYVGKDKQLTQTYEPTEYPED